MVEDGQVVPNTEYQVELFTFKEYLIVLAWDVILSLNINLASKADLILFDILVQGCEIECLDDEVRMSQVSITQSTF